MNEPQYKPGDFVEFLAKDGLVSSKNRLVPALVLEVAQVHTYDRTTGQLGPAMPALHVRPLGKTRLGRKHPQTTVLLSEARPLACFDLVHGSIFADWLEEHGEPRAAQKLREAFPLEGQK